MKMLLLLVLTSFSVYANASSSFEDRLRQFSPMVADVAIDMAQSQGITLSLKSFKSQIKDTSDFVYLLTLKNTCHACYKASISLLKKNNQAINELNVQKVMRTKQYSKLMKRY